MRGKYERSTTVTLPKGLHNDYCCLFSIVVHAQTKLRPVLAGTAQMAGNSCGVLSRTYLGLAHPYLWCACMHGLMLKQCNIRPLFYLQGICVLWLSSQL